MKSNVKEDSLIKVFIIERSPHCLQNLQKQFTLLAVGKKCYCWNVKVILCASEHIWSIVRYFFRSFKQL